MVWSLATQCHLTQETQRLAVVEAPVLKIQSLKGTQEGEDRDLARTKLCALETTVAETTMMHRRLRKNLKEKLSGEEETQGTVTPRWL